MNLVAVRYGDTRVVERSGITYGWCELGFEVSGAVHSKIPAGFPVGLVRNTCFLKIG